MVVTTLLAGLLLAQATPLIDLVSGPAKRGKGRPVTNSLVRSSFHNPKPDPKLPLKIELETTEPSQERSSVKTVQILITNVGKEPFPLPVGRDGDAVLSPENRHRREFQFGLWATKERYPPLTAGVTFGTPDVPDSLMLIPPNGIVRVRFKFDTELARGNWAVEGKEAIPVQAYCQELPYDDNPREYIIRHPGPDARSENEQMLILKRPGEKFQ